jgi:DNA-binding sugar fermentation-stimulating protein
MKGRFKAIVKINGKEILCYMPSSSKLGTLIDLPGKTTFLVPIKKNHSNFPYLVYAIRYKNSYALLYLQELNMIVENSLKRRQFDFLGVRTSIVREKLIAGYKSDLYVQDTKTLVEIKSILSFSKMAIFPSVHSDRAIEQLKKLRQLLEQGYNVYYFLISMYTSVEEVYLNC